MSDVIGVRVTKPEKGCEDCGADTYGLFCLACWKLRAGDLFPQSDHNPDD